MNTEQNMTQEEIDDVTEIVNHLRLNYMNAVWTHTHGSLTPKDVRDIQERYDDVKSQVISDYEKMLNEKLFSFFSLKRKNKRTKISLGDVIDIVIYKTITKPKVKLACYMWDKSYKRYVYPTLRNHALKPSER